MTHNSRSLQTKVKAEWNKIIEDDNEAGSSFDALAYECSTDWIEYGRGNRPGWGRPWWLYTQVSNMNNAVVDSLISLHKFIYL